MFLQYKILDIKFKNVYCSLLVQYVRKLKVKLK